MKVMYHIIHRIEIIGKKMVYQLVTAVSIECFTNIAINILTQNKIQNSMAKPKHITRSLHGLIKDNFQMKQG